MERYKFCPACTKQLERVSPMCLRCEACGFEVYRNPKLTVNVIVENAQGELLWVRRSEHAPFAGTWDTPGGFLEAGETAEEGARREVAEETGMHIDTLRYFRSYADEYEYQGMRMPLLAIAYVGTVSAASAISRPGDDAIEVKFMKPTQELIDQIPFSSDKQALIDYLKEKDS